MNVVNKELFNLSAINRTLVEDLDVSHRLLHELRQEKSALLRDVEAADARATQAELMLRQLGAQIQQVARDAVVHLEGRLPA